MVPLQVGASSVESEGEQLRALIKELHAAGADMVGFGDVSEGLAAELRHLPRAISIGVAYHNLEDNVEASRCLSERLEKAAKTLSYCQYVVTTWLRSQGWRFLAIPPDTHYTAKKFISAVFRLFSHKTAATCAGLGWIGKNGLLITPNFGPAVALATVLTNAPIPVCENPYKVSRCGHCRACVEACPAGAIKDQSWQRTSRVQLMIDASACKAFLSLNRGRCDYCIAVCPWTPKRRATSGG